MRRCALWFLVSVGCAAAHPEPTPPPGLQKTAATVARPAATAPSATPPTAPAPAAARAPVLLIVIVDQLGSWVFQQRRASLAPNGGFAKLAREGVYVDQLRYDHATSSTAPGHAALFTGLPPRESGVYANERLDETSGKPTSIFADPDTHEVLDDTALDAESSSAKQLEADTLADALRAQHPDARIISLSLKDRAAIPGGGRHPDAVVWFDNHRGVFVTSTAFHAALPPFARTENHALEAALSQPWKPLDEGWLRDHSPTSDDQQGEGDFGPSITFPHELPQSKERFTAFRGYPAADQAVLALALGALNDSHAESEPQRALLLSLSLSSFDYVGHVHGPDSWESWEDLRELDLALGVFFAELERRFGDRLAILLTADHGAGVLPETAGDQRARPWCGSATPDAFERPCDRGQRLVRGELEKRLKVAAKKLLGPGDWIRGVVEPFVYFTVAARALPEPRRQALEAASAKALQTHAGVAKVVVTRTVTAPCAEPSDASLDALVCRSLPKDSGDLYIVPRPGSFFDPNLVVGRGINHGTPYLYDRSVPVFVRAADHTQAGTERTTPIHPPDFTATAAALLHITPPSGATSGHDVLRAP